MEKIKEEIDKNFIDLIFDENFIISTYHNFSINYNNLNTIIIVKENIEIHEINFEQCYNKLKELFKIIENVKLKYGNQSIIYFLYEQEIIIDNINTDTIDILDFVPCTFEEFFEDEYVKIIRKTTYIKISINNCPNLKHILNLEKISNQISLSINDCPLLKYN